MATKTLKSPVLSRALDVQAIEVRKPEKGPHRISFSASSSLPLQRASGIEILDHNGVRLDRVRTGAAPLLFNHNWDDPRGMLDSARVVDGKLLVEAHLFDTPEAEQLRKMIEGGLRNISIGYRIYKVEQQTSGKYIARDFEILEASVCSVPADPTVGIGRGANAEEFPVEILSTNRGDSRMDEEERQRLAEEARTAERTRIAEIRNRCRTAKLGDDFAQRLINEGVEGDAIAARVLDAVATRQESAGSSRTEHRVSYAGDSTVQRGIEGVQAYLYARLGGTPKNPPACYHDFARMKIPSVVRHLVALTRGESIERLNRESDFDVMRMASYAERGGMHSTSDLPNLLAHAVGARLRDMQAMAQESFRPWVKSVTAPDFKAIERIALSSVGPLTKVNEGGEYKYISLDDSKKSYKLGKYGGIFAYSWESAVNDSLGGLEQLPTLMQESAKIVGSDLVYGMFTENSSAGPTMPDGSPLFHASHGNLHASAVTFDEAALSIARKMLRKMKDTKGQYLSVEPAFLIVSPERETVAEQLVSKGTIVKTSTVESPLNGWVSRLQLIVDPRVADNCFYLAARPGNGATVEFATLEGENGPVSFTREGWDVDAIELKIRYVVAAAWIDYTGIVKVPLS